MLKDRGQKALALKFCVSKRWLPQLEIEIEPNTRISTSKNMLTDIDVMGVTQASLSGSDRVIFDCKSGLRESPIGRTFWLSGVMSKTRSSHGFIIMNDKLNIMHDHRISAYDMKITLVQERDFENLAQCLGGTTSENNSFVGSIDVWETFFSISKKFQILDDYLRFSRSGYWMINNIGERCRKTIAKLRSIKTELDPSKPEHIAIFGDCLCLFLLTVSELTRRLYLILIKPTSKEEFTNTLLAILYDGQDNLQSAYKIKRLTSENPLDQEAISIFPEIKDFEQLIRETLECPSDIHTTALLSREISFAALNNFAISPLEIDLVRNYPFATKFILLASEYLTKAARLPVEFGQFYFNRTMHVNEQSTEPNQLL